MTAAELDALKQFFDSYVRRFEDPAGCLHPMQMLKLRHSRHVASNADRIAQACGWTTDRRRLGFACGLLHDVGRFSQYAEYQTFEDRRSIDHAARSVDVLTDEGALAALSTDERAILLTGIGLHNARDVPTALTADEADVTHLVRDADKIDIFRVFEEAVKDGHLDKHPEIAWGLDCSGKASPELVACIREGRSASYGMVRSLCDFALIQVGWIRGDIHFDPALALAAERRALDFREQFVLALDDARAVRDCLTVTRAAMAARLRKSCLALSGPRERD